MIYVNNPNLPLNADIVLLGEKYSYLSDSLNDNGLKALIVPSNSLVDSRLSSHVDLSVFFAGSNIIYLANYLINTNLHNQLLVLGFDVKFPDVYQNSNYPNDCQFNICNWNNYLLYNKKNAASQIISELLEKNDPIVLNCKQGYCKCLVSIVDDNSIITSDNGIASVCAEQGIDVLKITPGYIDLDGFDYGFIGGASFKASKDTMFFTGHLDEHPDKEKILQFLTRKNIKVTYLTENRIFDVGSILPITEK